MQSEDRLRVGVIGATRGVGFETARLLLEGGHTVSLHGRTQERVGRAIEALSQEFGKNVTGTVADFSKPGAAHGLYSSLSHALGRVDAIVIAVSARGPRAPLIQISEESMNEVMQVSVLNPMIVLRDAARAMVPAQHGHLVAVHSTACLVPLPSYALYTAAKSALAQLMDVLTKEVRYAGVRTTSIYPGSIYDGADREVMFLQSHDVAQSIIAALLQPAHLSLQSIVMRPLSDTNY